MLFRSCPSYLFEPECFPGTQSFPIQLVWLGIEPRDPPSSTSPGLGPPWGNKLPGLQTPMALPDCLHAGGAGDQTGSSCFHTKHFTHCTSSPAPGQLTLMIKQPSSLGNSLPLVFICQLFCFASSSQSSSSTRGCLVPKKMRIILALLGHPLPDSEEGKHPSILYKVP